MKFNKGNLIIGFLMLFISGYIIYTELTLNSTNLLYLGFLILSLSIMFFSLSYLDPQFKNKDERMRMIREKGMFISYFALMIYFFSLFLLLNFEFIALTGIEVIEVLASLVISTVFLSQVILSKIY